jgi:hypothetical protein
MRRDLALHFYAGATIAILTFATIVVLLDKPNYWLPAVVVFVAGAGKEIYDLISDKGTPEGLDAFVTCLGGAAGLALTFFIMSLF